MRTESRTRGTLLALLVIPLAIAAWMAAWSVGFFASVVSIGVVLLALALYRWGGHVVVGGGGAARIGVISLVAIILGLVAALLTQVAFATATALETDPISAVLDEHFVDFVLLTLEDAGGPVLLAGVFALGLGALTFVRFVVPRRRH